jgi:hypothetical protein
MESLDPPWAWSAYEPSKQQPWTLELAAHLHRRAGFAARWEELQQTFEQGPQATLHRLLEGGPEADSFYAQAEAGLRPLIATGNVEHLPAWWLHTMLHTPHPLKEKLTLFWHGHFATSAAKVTDPQLMYRQNALLRKHALGKFGPLVREISKDPAMLLWLDAAVNHKARPNENFAREVMELFCLGLGAYTERDIKEAARALTGWELRQGRFVFNAAQHDRGEKTVLGRTGKFNGDDLLDILLEQPAAARFLVRKLYRYLVSEAAEAPDQLIEPLAEQYARREFDTGWLVKTILGSNLFFSAHTVRQRIKSPVEFGIGLLRSLEGSANMYALADDLRGLGQGVFYPPNVKGWDGGQEWINSASLLARANLVWGLASGTEGRFKRPLPLVELARKHAGQDKRRRVQWLIDLLISSPLPDAVQVQLASVAADEAGDEQARLARAVQAIATLPEYQLI